MNRQKNVTRGLLVEESGKTGPEYASGRVLAPEISRKHSGTCWIQGLFALGASFFATKRCSREMRKANTDGVAI